MDPLAPRAYDPYAVPDMVRQFVQYFYRHIRERNLNEIFQMYRHTWAKLSERYFQATPWPHVDAVAEFVNRDHVFCLLYKEMYFRHLYSIAQPTIHARMDSWDNYRSLFAVILSDKVNMQLPNEWLWEMIDEFIYQFQSFCQYRCKLTQRTTEELGLLKKNTDVWDVKEVMSMLKQLISKSDVVHMLSTPGCTQKLYDTDGILEKGCSNVLIMLGYYALVGQVTVHVLMGEYTQALEAMYPLHPFERKGLMTEKVTMANITFFYYTAFSYLSLGRYLDAVRLYNHILAFVARVKARHQGQRMYDIILKKNEQMYRLLAIAVVQAPLAEKGLDDSVANALKEKCEDMAKKMRLGDVSTYEDAFMYACPKFVNAAVPDYESLPLKDVSQQCFRQQLQLFKDKIEGEKALPSLKQYLNLYSSLRLEKLCKLMSQKPEVVEQELEMLKKVSSCLTWVRGPPTAGELRPCSDIEVSTRQDADGKVVVDVKEIKAQRKQTDYMIGHIVKFNQICQELGRGPAPRPVPSY